MQTLTEIYARHRRCDKGSVHSYIDLYTELLAPYQGTARRVLEIGVFQGDSLRMWEEYFTQAQVHGADISLTPHDMTDLRPLIAEGTHNFHLMDATLAEHVEAAFQGMVFDVIIEDASHALEHQLAIYRNLKPHLAPGGIYIIEDVANLDAVRPQFEQIDPQMRVTIHDRRNIKSRFDDVLVVITDPETKLPGA